uniref:GLI-Kruppel family member GLI3 n=1 Tax=Mus musculus TaxID=10090 RepID=A0A1Y7VKQ8_MOUSE
MPDIMRAVTIMIHLLFLHYMCLLPYLVARRIQTCPSLGSPHTVIPLQPQSPPSAPHTPTSTHIWTTSAHCTAAHPSP